MTIPILGIIDAGMKIIDKVIPDPEARDKAKIALLEAQQRGELEELRVRQAPALAQIEVNKTEAASANIFVSGWRPAVGWVCVAAVLWHFVLVDFLVFALSLFGATIQAMPQLDIQELLGLLFAMLGIGTMRSVEKINGVAAR